MNCFQKTNQQWIDALTKPFVDPDVRKNVLFVVGICAYLIAGCLLITTLVMDPLIEARVPAAITISIFGVAVAALVISTVYICTLYDNCNAKDKEDE